MSTRSKFLVFGSPAIENPEILEVVKTMRSGWIGTGPKVHRFEQQFKGYKDVRYSVAVNSCTAALHLSLSTLKLKKDDEVITSPMTFCATANAIIHSGAVPVFADCEKDTFNIDPKEILKRITKRTKAIIPVHFAGRPCDMDEIMMIAKKYSLFVIEDCAHAIEAKYKGKHVGTFGHAGCFSFYVTKNIITGEGGIIITDDEGVANKVKVLALHGMTKDAWKRFGDEGYKHYQVVDAGFKYNMTDLQASIGIHQLKRIEKYWRRRKQIWEMYDKAFKDLPCFLPKREDRSIKHSRHLYTLLLDIDRLKISRDGFLNEMTKRNIGVGVHYIALHLHPYYKKTYHYKKGDFPNAEYISERTVSLPLSAKLTDRDVRDVISAVSGILEKNLR